MLMILKMSLLTAMYVLITAELWLLLKNKKKSIFIQIAVGVIYGLCAVLSTHFGVNYGRMVLNLRDVAPLAAGIFFHPVSGMIAGVIGGVERYIVGTYFHVGEYTRIACSISTLLAGVIGFLIGKYGLGKTFEVDKPVRCLFIGCVVEVFHMYVVLITHRNDMQTAFLVVKSCSGPMILFSGIGLGLCSVTVMFLSGSWTWSGLFAPDRKEKTSLSSLFQKYIFLAVAAIFALTFFVSYLTQTRAALQSAVNTLDVGIRGASYDVNVLKKYFKLDDFYDESRADSYDRLMQHTFVGSNGSAFILNRDRRIVAGYQKGVYIKETKEFNQPYGMKGEKIRYFYANVLGKTSLCREDAISDNYYILVEIPEEEIYWDRNSIAYETFFADILLFAGIIWMISFFVQHVIVKNLNRVNDSLALISRGKLEETVSVRDSSEFVFLSDSINLMVKALRGYIDAEKHRMEKELALAREIQASALPRNFTFPGRTDVEIFALMNPAREVGGDFYDFFFLGGNKMAILIADVSGKGIPAALFMMQSKAAIRSLAESGLNPSEIFRRTNERLCEGNDLDMFVTAWLAIVDLDTGVMKCANAGHEYPALMRAGGRYELLKDRHSMVLAAMEDIPYNEYELTLGKGDRIFVYTDGVPEALNNGEEQYGTDRLLAALNASKDMPMKDIIPAVREDIRGFVGEAEPFDDITMLGFAYHCS